MKVLCFGSHPDDLEIGMGGTISKFIKKGFDLQVVVARECIGNRFEEQRKANEVLGVTKFTSMNLKLTQETEMEEIGLITQLIEACQPDRVYVHCNNDSNQHHRRLSKYVMSALRRTNISMYLYSPTTIRSVTVNKFAPTVYEDISEEFDTKLKAIKCHKSQMDKYGDDYYEYVQHKDAHNGYEIDVRYAELFQIVKEVRK